MRSPAFKPIILASPRQFGLAALQSSETFWKSQIVGDCPSDKTDSKGPSHMGNALTLTSELRKGALLTQA